MFSCCITKKLHFSWGGMGTVSYVSKVSQAANFYQLEVPVAQIANGIRAKRRSKYLLSNDNLPTCTLFVTFIDSTTVS